MKKGDIEKIKDAVLMYKATKVAVQIPEGMKTEALAICDEIEKLGVMAVLVADPCFGACDIPDSAMKSLGCDLIVHFGHSQFVGETDIPVVYAECRVDEDFIGVIEKEIGLLSGFKKIGLVAVIQCVGYLDGIRKALEDKGFEVFIGKPSVAKYPGQVLGCDHSAAVSVSDKVDCFLYVGSGRFHPLGVARACGKPVFCLDAGSRKILLVDDEKKRYDTKLIMKQARFEEAKNVGVLVSVKRGQMDKNVFQVKDTIEKMDKKAYIISMDHISPEKLLGMKLDVLVNTACPRIEEDVVFSVPVINWGNLK